MNSRSQFKSISYKSLFSVTIDHGYSAVSIGARQVFGVDEWTRTIYHIDASGTMHTTAYHQGYDMTDVIAQVSEAIEVLKEFYTAEKLESIAQAECTRLVLLWCRQPRGCKGLQRATSSGILETTF